MKEPNYENLTDEQVLKEFVKRFKCDGAVLIYLDSKLEIGFGRWNSPDGRKWVNEVFKSIKKQINSKGESIFSNNSF